MNKLKKEILYNKLLSKTGLETQLIVAIEECSELQKELTKIIRNMRDTWNIAEEIADVQICIEQIEQHLKLTDKIREIKKWKLTRLKLRYISEDTSE